MWYAEERISRESVSGSPSKTAQKINGEEPMIMTRIQTLTLLMLTLALALPSTSFSDTFTITTGEDVAPYQFLPNNNRGTYTTNYAFSGTGGHDFESYVNFDLSGVALPQGHVVTNATFFIAYAFDFTAFGDTNQDPGNLIVYRVDEPWGEMTLTWSNRPSATVAVDQVDDITEFGAMVFNVTDLVQEWLDGTRPNNGIALKSDLPRVIGMHSFEATADPSLKATLIITTQESNPVPGFGPISLGILTMLMATVGAVQLRRRA